MCSTETLASLCRNMRISVPRSRQRSEYVEAVERYTRRRQQCVRQGRELSRTDLANIPVIPESNPEHWYVDGAMLKERYECMRRKDLHEECCKRCLSIDFQWGVHKRTSEQKSATTLRKILLAADTAFESLIPRSPSLQSRHPKARQETCCERPWCVRPDPGSPS